MDIKYNFVLNSLLYYFGKRIRKLIDFALNNITKNEIQEWEKNYKPKTDTRKIYNENTPDTELLLFNFTLG